MRFLLSFLLVFICVFATAQVPPMVIGGPQGIDVTRILTRNWMNVPIYLDTPAAPLTGSGWPGRGYLITVVKNESPCQSCPPKDTSLWIYTGSRWKRVGMDYVTRLVYGGQVSKASGSNLNYVIQPYGAFFDGDYRSSLTNKTATLSPKTINNTGRIDVLVLNRDSFRVKTGTPNKIPQKPTVFGNEIEVASFYFEAFDSIPSMINTSAKVTNIYRVEGIDSIYFNIDTLTFAIRDSVGITKNDTAAMLNKYKFTAANGLTKDSTVFRLGGSLNQNTSINLNTRRLTIIGGADTTRFFPSGTVSIGGTPDSIYRFNVNGDARIRGILRLQPTSPSNTAIIVNQNANDGSLVWGSSLLNLPSFFGARNVIISPQGAYNTLTGGQNVLIGRASGSSITTGANNTFVGNNTGSSITTGIQNTMIGASDGWSSLPATTQNAIQLVAGGHESNRADTALLGLTSRYAFIGGGSFNAYINDYYFGGGNRVRFTNDAHVNFYAPSAFPTKADTIGSNFTINAGRGTGVGLGGSVIFQTSDTTTAGTTLQTLTERARITSRGNLLVGTSTDSTFRLDVNGTARFQTGITINRTGNEPFILLSTSNTTFSQIRGNGTTGVSIANNVGAPIWTFGVTGNTFAGNASARSIGRFNLSGFGTGPSQFPALFAENTNIDDSSSGPEMARFQSNINTKNMVNGYGGAITFYVRDIDSVDRHVSSIRWHRQDNDSSGSISFHTSRDKVISEAVRISHRGNLLVGTTTDDTSSLVNIVSTAKGFLQPRMTNTQRDAIATPATGLQLFSTTDSANYVYRGTGGGWQKIANEISGSATLDFPSTNNGNKSDLTINGITGAEEGDVVALGIQNSVNLNHSCFTAWVSASGQVTVRFSNYGTGSLDPVQATFKIKVFK